MNFFIEKSRNAISGDDVHYYSGDDAKKVWMRETKIRMFMQLELEACLEKVNWMIRCHNCEALNCPLEEYPARPLPIPPDYIDNFQSTLIKVKKGILPPTLKMIINTRYHLPARPAPKTSPIVQPGDMMGGHRDGENSSQGRPRASEEGKKMVANGTSSTDEGGDFISQTEVETDNEATQLADPFFGLATFWQHQGTTAKSTDWGGDNTIQADFAGNLITVLTARVTAARRLRSASITEGRR